AAHICAGSPSHGSLPPVNHPLTPHLNPAAIRLAPGRQWLRGNQGMFVERNEIGETTSQERRDLAQPESRVLSRDVQCDGARAMLAAYAQHDSVAANGLWTVGRLVSINLGSIRTVGLVYRIETPSPQQGWAEEGQNPINVHVELVGEVRDDD